MIERPPKVIRNGEFSVDFSEWEVDAFSFCLTSRYSAVRCGCGATLLGLLMHKHPKVYANLNRNKKHYSRSFVLKILKEKFFIREIDEKKDLLNRNQIEYRITKNHILLTIQQALADEYSWFVYYGGKQFHNYEIFDVYPTEFVCNPIYKNYLLYPKNYDSFLTQYLNENSDS